MNQGFCKHLRTKAMYILAEPEAALAKPAEHEFSPCHFWCNLTQSAVGVDDRPVHKDLCQAPRACFEQ